MVNNGAIYVATGSRYVREAEKAYEQLKRVMPDIAVTLFTDKPVESSSFEQIALLEHPLYQNIDKTLGLQASPYDRTLFMDTDTYVVEDISGIFDLLDEFDFAIAHAPNRKPNPKRGYAELWKSVPDEFPMLNSGLIALKRSAVTDDLLREWQRLYDQFRQELKVPKTLDQPALRQALYFSPVRLAVLPPEYNFRTLFFGYADGPIKVLHGRHRNIAKIAADVNKSTDRRIAMIRETRVRLVIDKPRQPGYFRRAGRFLKRPIRRIIKGS